MRIDTHIQRVTGVTMEPRSALGNYDPADGRYTLFAGRSGVVRHKAVVVKAVVDALSAYGIKHLEMPLTPGRGWQAIRDARAQRQGRPMKTALKYRRGNARGRRARSVLPRRSRSMTW